MRPLKYRIVQTTDGFYPQRQVEILWLGLRWWWALPVKRWTTLSGAQSEVSWHRKFLEKETVVKIWEDV